MLDELSKVHFARFRFHLRAQTALRLLGEPLTELGKGTEDTANNATAPAADAAANARFRSAFRRQVYRLQAVVMDGAAYAPFEL